MYPQVYVRNNKKIFWNCDTVENMKVGKVGSF